MIKTNKEEEVQPMFKPVSSSRIQTRAPFYISTLTLNWEQLALLSQKDLPVNVFGTIQVCLTYLKHEQTPLFIYLFIYIYIYMYIYKY